MSSCQGFDASTLDDLLLVGLVMVLHCDLLLGLCHVDVSHSIFAIEDLGDLLERRTLGLNKDEVNPDEFDQVPALQRISKQNSTKVCKTKLTV